MEWIFGYEFNDYGCGESRSIALRRLLNILDARHDYKLGSVYTRPDDSQYLKIGRLGIYRIVYREIQQRSGEPCYTAAVEWSHYKSDDAEFQRTGTVPTRSCLSSFRAMLIGH